MTRNDFEIIAEVLHAARLTDDTHPNDCAAHNYALDTVARAFADRLKLVNPRFNRAIFLRACGVES